MAFFHGFQVKTFSVLAEIAILLQGTYQYSITLLIRCNGHVYFDQLIL